MGLLLSNWSGEKLVLLRGVPVSASMIEATRGGSDWRLLFVSLNEDGAQWLLSDDCSGDGESGLHRLGFDAVARPEGVPGPRSRLRLLQGLPPRTGS